MTEWTAPGQLSVDLPRLLALVTVMLLPCCRDPTLSSNSEPLPLQVPAALSRIVAAVDRDPPPASLQAPLPDFFAALAPVTSVSLLRALLYRAHNR